MSSTTEAHLTLTAIRSALPSSNTNPFLAVLAVFNEKFYPVHPHSFIVALRAAHALFAVQTVLLLLALGVRLWRNKKDVWVFRLTPTAKGSFLVPHFAVAWQLCSLVFLVALQPYLEATIAHTLGNEPRRYLLFKLVVFLPVWLSTWVALWSLTVAVVLPSATSSSSTSPSTRFATHRFLRTLITPLAINSHFIFGGILFILLVLIFSIKMSNSYDNSVTLFVELRENMLALAPRWESMSSEEVDLAMGGSTEEVVQRLLDGVKEFQRGFRVSWGIWAAIAMYTYGVFVGVAAGYFHHLRKSMRKLESDSGTDERAVLRRSFFFLVSTIVLVSFIGVVYVAVSLFMSIENVQATTDPLTLRIETLLAMYGFGAPCLLCSILSLLQALQRTTYTPSASSGAGSGSNSGPILSRLRNSVTVSVLKRTHVEEESESKEAAVEMGDWRRLEEEEKSGEEEVEEVLRRERHV